MHAHILTPTLLLDTEKCKRNIRRMAQKAQNAGVIFRPHFKTHQSAKVGEWFREAGVDRITVSSVAMAKYFHSHGWNDITIAFPVNIRETDRINHLAETCKLNLLIDSSFTAAFLAKNLVHPAGFFIETDCGQHRSGLPPDDTRTIDEILELTKRSKYMHCKGFLTHAGHTYAASGREEIKKIHLESAALMNTLKNNYAGRLEECIISAGDTPSCSIADSFDGIDEIRPGNFVFYDLMQAALESCTPDDIAIALASPVVSVYPSRGEVIVYGGAVHLSKECLTDRSGQKSYGAIVKLTGEGWEFPEDKSNITALSQEHGVVKASSALLKEVRPGELVGVLPIHACLTVNLMRTLYTLQNEKIFCSDISNRSIM